MPTGDQPSEDLLLSLHQSLGESFRDTGLGPEFVRLTRALREKRFPLGSRQIQEVEIDGRWRFKVDMGDRLGADVYFGNYREMLDVEAFCRTLSPGDKVIDVGANFGFVSIVAAGYLGSRGQVLAFEPDEHAHALLTANVKLNRLGRRIKIVKRCISDQDGNVSFFRAQESAFSGMADTGRSKVEVVEMVRAQRLDDAAKEFGLRQVNALKIDVEGFEYAVLGGGRALLERSTDPLVMFEVSSKNLDENRRSRLAAVLDDLLKDGWEAWCYAPERDEFSRFGSLAELLAAVTGNAFLARAKSERLGRLRAAYRAIVEARLLPAAIRQYLSGKPVEPGDPAGPRSLHRLIWNSFLTEWGAKAQADLAGSRLKIAQSQAGLETLQGVFKQEQLKSKEVQTRLEAALAESARLVAHIRQLESETRAQGTELARLRQLKEQVDQEVVQAGLRESLLKQGEEHLRQVQQALVAAQDRANERNQALELRVAQLETEAAALRRQTQETLAAQEGEVVLQRGRAEKQAAELAGAAQRLELQRQALEQERLKQEQMQRVMQETERRANERNRATELRVAQLETEAAALTRQTQETLAAKEAEVVQQRGRAEKQAAELAGAAQRLEVQRQTLEQQRQKLEQLQQAAGAAQERANERNQTLELRVAQLEAESTALNRQTQAALAAQQDEVQQLRSRAEQQAAELAGAAQRLEVQRQALEQQAAELERRQRECDLQRTRADLQEGAQAQQQVRIGQLEAEVTSLRQAVATAEGKTRELGVASAQELAKHALAGKQGLEERNRLFAELSGCRDQLARLKEELAASQAQLAAVHSAKTAEFARLGSTHQVEMNQIKAAAEDSSRTAIRLTGELAAARSLIEQREQALQAMRQECGLLQKQHQAELSASRTERTDLGTKLDEVRRELSIRETELSRLKQSADHTERALQAREQELQAAAGDAAGWKGRADQSALALVRLERELAACAAGQAALQRESQERGVSLQQLTALWTSTQQENEQRGLALQELTTLWQATRAEVERQQGLLQAAELEWAVTNERARQAENELRELRARWEAGLGQRFRRWRDSLAEPKT